MTVHFENPSDWRYTACGRGVPRQKPYAPIHAAGHVTDVTIVRSAVTCRSCLAAMAKRPTDNPEEWKL